MVYLTIGLRIANVPVDLIVEDQLTEPAPRDGAQLLSQVFDLLNRDGQLLYHPELGRLESGWYVLALVNDAFDTVADSRIFPLKVALIPCRVKTDKRFDSILQVFENHRVDDLDAALAADRPVHLPVELVEADFAPVSEGYRLRAAQSRLRVIHAHTRTEGVVAVQGPELVYMLDVKVGDRWVVRSMLAEESAPVTKRSLMSLSEQRIEGFCHVEAEVHARNAIGNHVL